MKKILKIYIYLVIIGFFAAIFPKQFDAFWNVITKPIDLFFDILVDVFVGIVDINEEHPSIGIMAILIYVIYWMNKFLNETKNIRYILEKIFEKNVS